MLHLVSADVDRKRSCLSRSRGGFLNTKMVSKYPDFWLHLGVDVDRKRSCVSRLSATLF